MKNKIYLLEVAQDDREALVLCLTLGTLETIRRGDWLLEVGIWTLGRLLFWKPLTEVDDTIIEVLSSADELSALEELGGRLAAEAALDRMIEVVRSRLFVLSETSWYARCSDETEGLPPSTAIS